jgi:hypothetical protein
LDTLVNEGRKNHESYYFFVRHYLVCAGGKKETSQLQHESPSSVFTISDEAMVLWQLENSWDIWIDMKAKGVTNKSTLDPKYTVSGDKGGSRKFGGWTSEGKIRYNALFDLVEEQCSGPIGREFEKYCGSMQANGANLTKKRKKKALPPDAVASPAKIRNTLSSLSMDQNSYEQKWGQTVDHTVEI